jgi:hypothetical protein
MEFIETSPISSTGISPQIFVQAIEQESVCTPHAPSSAHQCALPRREIILYIQMHAFFLFADGHRTTLEPHEEWGMYLRVNSATA